MSASQQKRSYNTMNLALRNRNETTELRRLLRQLDREQDYAVKSLDIDIRVTKGRYRRFMPLSEEERMAAGTEVLFRSIRQPCVRHRPTEHTRYLPNGENAKTPPDAADDVTKDPNDVTANRNRMAPIDEDGGNTHRTGSKETPGTLNTLNMRSNHRQSKPPQSAPSKPQVKGQGRVGSSTTLTSMTRTKVTPRPATRAW